MAKKVVAHLHVGTVVCLQRIIDGVLCRPVALIHKHVAQRSCPTLVEERIDGGEGPFRTIGNVVVISILLRVRPVAVVLERACEQERVALIVGVHRHVHTHAARVAIVEHGPLVRPLQRQTHNAVLHMVIIEVGLQVETVGLVDHAHIKLLRILWLQVTVSHQRVVEVVKRRCAKHALIERAQRPGTSSVRSQGVPCHLTQGLRRAVGVVADVGVEAAEVDVQSVMAVKRRQRCLTVHAVDIMKILHIGCQIRPSEVCRCRQPEASQAQRGRRRTINVLLVIPVVAVHRYVFRIIGAIVEVVVGIFHDASQAETSKLFAVGEL